MSTSTTVDHGDYVETIEGEPTWQNPTVWRSVRVDWKPGTPPANERALRDDLLASIAALKTDIDTMNTLINTANATINASPASFIKDCARMNKDTARAAIRLAKLALSQFTDADAGAA